MKLIIIMALLIASAVAMAQRSQPNIYTCDMPYIGNVTYEDASTCADHIWHFWNDPQTVFPTSTNDHIVGRNAR